MDHELEGRLFALEALLGFMLGRDRKAFDEMNGIFGGGWPALLDEKDPRFGSRRVRTSAKATYDRILERAQSLLSNNGLK